MNYIWKIKKQVPWKGILKSVYMHRAKIGMLTIFVIYMFTIMNTETKPKTTIEKNGGTTTTMENEKEEKHVQRVLIAISTSYKNLNFVLLNYNSYDPNEVHIHINIYDTLSGTLSDTLSDTENIFYTNIPGMKPVFWAIMDEQRVSNYDYIWFLDDDFVFSKNTFHFDGFLKTVQYFDSALATPNIIRKNRYSKMHKATIEYEPLADNFIEERNMIEVDSCFFKIQAWIFIHKNILVKEVTDSCWGIDCVWCGVLKMEKFGKIPCMVTPHFGVMHLDTGTLTRKNEKFNNQQNGLAMDLYKERVDQLYDGRIEFNCRPTKRTTVPFDGTFLKNTMIEK